MNCGFLSEFITPADTCVYFSCNSGFQDPIDKATSQFLIVNIFIKGLHKLIFMLLWGVIELLGAV